MCLSEFCYSGFQKNGKDNALLSSISVVNIYLEENRREIWRICIFDADSIGTSCLCSIINTLRRVKKALFTKITFIFHHFIWPHAYLVKKVSQDLGAFIMPIIQMNKLRLREIKLLT